MIWLLFSVILSSSLFLLFKLYAKHNVNIFSTIVVNYIVCTICGILFSKPTHFFSTSGIFNTNHAMLISVGILFIISFNLMGKATKEAGAAAASIASKMSVVFPVLYAVLYLSEVLAFHQIVGIIISLISVILMGLKKNHQYSNNSAFLLVLGVFLGSGAVDLTLTIVNQNFGKVLDSFTLSTLVFMGAAILGSLLWLFKKDRILRGKEIAGGLILGIANYFSLVAMFNALEHYAQNKAWFFAINNIGVVLLSSCIGFLFFKEKLYTKEWVGILLAIIAIFLINYAA